MYRAVGFDIGDTLLYYADTPLDWSSHYPDALSAVARVCDIAPDNRQINAACDVLQHYNARIRPRAEEVSADEIFLHILSAWSLPANEHLKTAVDAFFMFFQQRMCAFPETVSVLRTLRSSGLRVGALTDVPYGMPQRFVDRDLERAHLAALLDAVVTSAMAGCRKPAIDGYLLLASRLGVEPDEMLYVGNEPKDVLGAQQARIRSAFLCRTGEAVDHGQNYTISSLRTVLDICGLRSDGDAVSTGSRP
jgi:putative hydrolase of the HAD superfamily